MSEVGALSLGLLGVPLRLLEFQDVHLLDGPVGFGKEVEHEGDQLTLGERLSRRLRGFDGVEEELSIFSFGGGLGAERRDEVVVQRGGLRAWETVVGLEHFEEPSGVWEVGIDGTRRQFLRDE